MRTIFAASLIILAAILVVASSSADAATTMLGMPAGCIFRRTLKRFDGNNYNVSTFSFNEPLSSANSWSFQLLSDGSFQVNINPEQGAVIGNVPGNPSLYLAREYFCNKETIQYTAGTISGSKVAAGQTYCVINTMNTFGSNYFALNVVSMSSTETVIDVVALMLHTPSRFNPYCFFKQSMGENPPRCPSNEWIKISTPCN